MSMKNAAIAREVWNRIEFQKKKKGGLLSGLKLCESAEYRVDGDDALPNLALIDISSSDELGPSVYELTLFLKTKKDFGLFRKESAPEGTPDALADWMDKIQDAVETSPSTGKADPMLFPHNADGTPKLVNGRHLELLGEAFTWNLRMAEITPVSFLMQMDIRFRWGNAKRAGRV